MALLSQDCDDSIFLQIVDTFGKKHQLRKLAEELTEAGAALQSWLNAKEEGDLPTLIKDKENNAYKEIGDVIFMLRQRDFILNPDKVKRNLQAINLGMIKRLERVREARSKGENSF